MEENHSALELIRKLELKEHPEGGYYRRTYRSELELSPDSLPAGYSGSRPASTAIYYLLTSDDFSAFHRLKSEETWHFHRGEPLHLYVLGPESGYEKHVLGPRVESGQRPRVTIPPETPFAAEVPSGYALLGCTVIPGFDFEDFEIVGREELLSLYPDHEHLIRRLTRPDQD